MVPEYILKDLMETEDAAMIANVDEVVFIKTTKCLITNVSVTCQSRIQCFKRQRIVYNREHLNEQTEDDFTIIAFYRDTVKRSINFVDIKMKLERNNEFKLFVHLLTRKYINVFNVLEPIDIKEK